MAQYQMIIININMINHMFKIIIKYFLPVHSKHVLHIVEEVTCLMNLQKNPPGAARVGVGADARAIGLPCDQDPQPSVNDYLNKDIFKQGYI